MSANDKRVLFTLIDLAGLGLAWAMFGTRYLPYFVIVFIALPLVFRSR